MILAVFITTTYSQLGWSECPPAQSKIIEIIPTSCNYLNPYEYETWQCLFNGSMEIIKDIEK